MQRFYRGRPCVTLVSTHKGTVEMRIRTKVRGHPADISSMIVRPGHVASLACVLGLSGCGTSSRPVPHAASWGQLTSALRRAGGLANELTHGRDMVELVPTATVKREIASYQSLQRSLRAADGPVVGLSAADAAEHKR